MLRPQQHCLKNQRVYFVVSFVFSFSTVTVLFVFFICDRFGCWRLVIIMIIFVLTE